VASFIDRHARAGKGARTRRAEVRA
jgi:hypothetical protein